MYSHRTMLIGAVCLAWLSLTPMVSAYVTPDVVIHSCASTSFNQHSRMCTEHPLEAVTEALECARYCTDYAYVRDSYDGRWCQLTAFQCRGGCYSSSFYELTTNSSGTKNLNMGIESCSVTSIQSAIVCAKCFNAYWTSFVYRDLLVNKVIGCNCAAININNAQPQQITSKLGIIFAQTTATVINN